jgi:3-hydroxyisobutyrate dehydrogenase
VKKEKVAFLGLGAIGTPMARHLAQKGFDLTVWTRDAAKRDAFAAKHGSRAAKSPAEAASGVDVVITCLPSSIEVEQVANSADGIFSTIPRGAVLLDCTSGDPEVSKKLAAVLTEKGCAFVDAPVSGGVAGAEAGKLTVMCGGDAKDFERVRPIMEAFGEKIVLCGPVGAGHAVKALNQMLLALHIWTTGEALAALVRYGVDPARALEVINGSSGRSNSSMNLIPERVLTRAFPRTFRLALLDKDVRIAARIAEKQGSHSAIFAEVERIMAETHAELGEEADHVEAIRVLERITGVEIKAK